MKYSDAQMNRVLEHLALKHATHVLGCPWCDGDEEELGEAIERDLGLLDD